MSTTGLSVFDETIHLTNAWLKEMMDSRVWEDRQRAYRALRVVLHSLRDRLPLIQVTDLAAQLPMLVRGFYYEGWQPEPGPTRDQTVKDFVVHVDDAFVTDPDEDPERIVRAVFTLLSSHVSAGEIKDVIGCLPKEIKSLWVD